MPELEALYKEIDAWYESGDHSAWEKWRMQTKLKLAEDRAIDYINYCRNTTEEEGAINAVDIVS